MRRYCAAWVLQVTTVLLPVFAVYAADSPLHPQSEAGATAQQTQAATARADPPPAAAADGPSTGLKLNLDAVATLPRSDELRHSVPLTTSSARPDDFRLDPAIGAATSFSRAEDSLYGFPVGAPKGTGLTLTPAPSASRPGWEMSGRVGPLRFLSPLDGEGDTRMRLGGRVPGQPRMPGMGLFNLGIHYNFE